MPEARRPVSLRLRPSEYDRVKRAAAWLDEHPSTFARQALLAFADEMLRRPPVQPFGAEVAEIR